MRGSIRPPKGRLHAVRDALRGRVGPHGTQGKHEPCHTHKHACSLASFIHVPLCRLASLPRRFRYIARHSMPLHRHGRVNYLCIPHGELLTQVLNYDARFDFIEQSGHFADDLVRNHEAFAKEAAKYPVVRSLGRPRPLLDTITLMNSHIEKRPPPTVVEHPTTVLPGYKSVIVNTPQGERPLAGSFSRALAHWAQYRARPVRPRTLAMIHKGVTLKFNGPLPAPLWLQNHRHSEADAEFISKEIDALLDTDAIGYYDVAQMGLPICICPIMVTMDTSGKRRLVWDGRYTNSFLRNLYVRFENIDGLTVLLLESPDCPASQILLLKVDLKSGYHHLRMHPSAYPFLCFVWDGVLYCWLALPFGLKLAPWAFEMCMKDARSVLRSLGNTPHMGYLDDSGIPLYRQLQVPVNTLVQETTERHSEMQHTLPQADDPVTKLLQLAFFGMVANIPKLRLDSYVEMLGIDIDVHAQRKTVPKRREDTLMPLLHEVASSAPGHRIPARQLARVAGYIISMYPALRHARTMLWSITYALYPFNLSNQWDGRLTIPAAVRDTCQWWEENFNKCNGRPFRELPQFTFEWDAAKAGAGAHLHGMGQHYLLHVDRPAAERALHNTLWELVAAPDLILPVLPVLAGHCFAMFGDCMYAVSYLRRGGGSDPLPTAMVQKFFRLLLEYDAELLRVGHIPGHQNCIPDAVSRHVDFQGDWALHPSALHLVHMWMAKLALPAPTCEGFASALNHHHDRWCSRWIEPGSSWTNFYGHCWEDECVWINPPFSLLRRTVHHIVLHRIHCYLIIPQRPSDVVAPWWDLAWRLQAAHMRLPPAAFTSVATGHTSGFHDPGYHIHLLYITFG